MIMNHSEGPITMSEIFLKDCRMKCGRENEKKIEERWK